METGVCPDPAGPMIPDRRGSACAWAVRRCADRADHSCTRACGNEGTGIGETWEYPEIEVSFPDAGNDCASRLQEWYLHDRIEKTTRVGKGETGYTKGNGKGERESGYSNR